MFAKNLEALLVECCQDSDVSPIDEADVAARFESLRAYGQLPRGRESRAKRLWNSEIAAAITGLVPLRANWAGRAAIILTDLRPVGGEAASFAGASTLSSAIETLVTDETSRKMLCYLTLSVSESGVNSHGQATLVYEADGVRRRIPFVPKLAVSQLQPGAGAAFDHDRMFANASRGLSLSRKFFERLGKAIAHSRAFPLASAGDGTEYDAEEARQVRYAALGVTRHSRYLSVGVDAHVTWPSKEMLVAFGGYKIVLMPAAGESTQSVHIDLHANHLSEAEALTVINRLLSLMAWCDDQFSVARDGRSGGPVPLPVPRRTLAFSATPFWALQWEIPDTDEQQKALALYREGLNAAEAGLISYSVLSFFKVIEVKFGRDKIPQRIEWIRRHSSKILSDLSSDVRIKHFVGKLDGRAPEDYIYNVCRHEVAHHLENGSIDLDDADEIQRLSSASYVLRLLARRLIADELSVPEGAYPGR